MDAFRFFTKLDQTLLLGLRARKDGTGVLILSEMAGAAKELAEAIIVNPNNRAEIAGALRDALATPVEEQKRRNSLMQRRLLSPI